MKRCCALAMAFILLLSLPAFASEPPTVLEASALCGFNFTTGSVIGDAKAVSWGDCRGAFITFPMPNGFSVGENDTVYARFSDLQMSFDNGRKWGQAPVAMLRLAASDSLSSLNSASASALKSAAKDAARFDTLNSDFSDTFDITDYIKAAKGYITLYITCRAEDNAFESEGIVKFNAPRLTLTIAPRVQKTHEELDRGLVAVKTEGGVYLSWRHVQGEGEYTLYRDGAEIAKTTLTNFLDKGGSIESVYSLSGCTATVWEKPYLEIALSPPAADSVTGATYSPGDASTGDLDGDGEMEIVLKWDPSDAKDAATNGKTGKVFIDAYKLDGTRLWRIDMGRNVRAGAHDTQFLVYDFDCDGCAEIAMRTADGTLDGVGNAVGDKDALWTDNSLGKNLDGPLYLSVFSGKSGKLLVSEKYDPQSNAPSTKIFGDNYGNRSERYLAAVAYLDGETPSMIFVRGYYYGKSGYGPGRTVVAAWDFKKGELSERWRFDTMDGDNSKYIGQGNHNISVGDADGDGRDEVFLGSLTIDDNGTPLWCSFMGHGDAQHLGDFDPTHEGLEYFTVHEDSTANQPYGFSIHDAATGEVLISRGAGKDTGRGMIANVGDYGGSFVAWAASGAQHVNSKGETVPVVCNSMNFRIYWDGDLYDELLDGTSIFKVKGADGHLETLFDASQEGCASNNSTKSNPCLSADILGDWREEVIWRTVGNTAIRIYTTTIPTLHTLPCLLTDHVYRMGVAWQNTAYNQPPHLGYYVTEEKPVSLSQSAALGWNFTSGSAIGEVKAVSWGDRRGAFITFPVPSDFKVAKNEVVSAQLYDDALSFDNGRQAGQAPVVSLFVAGEHTLANLTNTSATALRDGAQKVASMDTLTSDYSESFDLTPFITHGEKYVTLYISCRAEDDAFLSDGIVKFNAPKLLLSKKSAKSTLVAASLEGTAQSGSFTYTLTAQNSSFESARITIGRATYQGGVLTAFQSRDGAIDGQGSLTKTYTAPMQSGADTRIFVWSANSLLPLCEALSSK